MNTPTIGRWFAEHYRDRQDDAGTFRAAAQLRKQGVPLHIALLVLGDRSAFPDTQPFSYPRADAFADYEADMK